MASLLLSAETEREYREREGTGKEVFLSRILNASAVRVYLVCVCPCVLVSVCEYDK